MYILSIYLKGLVSHALGSHANQQVLKFNELSDLCM